MKCGIRTLFFIFCLFLSASAGLCGTETIKVATFDWCPFICPDDAERPGLFVEYAKAVFDRAGYKTEFVPYPWSRAIQAVRRGQVDAILAPAKNEVPDIVFPKTEIGIQRFCFFKMKKDRWKYDNPDSVTGRKIVYPQDALPEDLASVKHKAAKFDSMPYSKRYLEATTKQLAIGRYDSVLMTYYSMIDYLNKNKLADSVKSAGCVGKQNLYLAFTPLPGKREQVQKLVDVFDREIAELIKIKYIEGLISKYGLD